MRAAGVLVIDRKPFVLIAAALSAGLSSTGGFFCLGSSFAVASVLNGSGLAFSTFVGSGFAIALGSGLVALGSGVAGLVALGSGATVFGSGFATAFGSG